MATKAKIGSESILDNAWGILGNPLKKQVPPTRNWLDVRNALLAYGLPYIALAKLISVLHIEDPNEVPEVFHITTKTLQRRKKEHHLKSDEAIRIFGVAEIVARATSIFGDGRTATNWLKKPNRALGNERPIMLLTDIIGKKLVEDLLGRIKHGIYS